MLKEIPIYGEFNLADKELLLQDAWEAAKARNTVPVSITVLNVNENEYEVRVEYEPRIKRVRRISGYLAPTDRWNAAKLAELSARKAHSFQKP